MKKGGGRRREGEKEEKVGYESLLHF